MVAKTVTVKLRLASFKTITRSRTLPEPTDVAHVIYATASALYEGSGLDARARLRLVGVRAAGLRPASGAATQLAFGDRPVGWREAEQAVDQIARKFGAGAVRPAALVSGDRDQVPQGSTARAAPGRDSSEAGPAGEPSPEGRSPSSTARAEARILGNESGT